MVIRRVPEDFLVVERLAFNYELAVEPGQGAGKFALYKMRKRAMTTPDAIRAIARELRTTPGRFGYGGLKDRHAMTVQHITIEIDPAKRRSLPTYVHAAYGDLAWAEIKFLGTTDRPMTAEAIAANVFRIVIRRCLDADFAMMAERCDRIRSGRDLLLTNYYGSQRFGSARHGQGWVARALLEGDYEQALKLTIASPARKDSGDTRSMTRMCAEKWGNWQELVDAINPTVPERLSLLALAAGKSFAEAYGRLPGFVRELHVDAFASLLWNSMARRLTLSMDDQATMVEDDFNQIAFATESKVVEPYRSLQLPHLAAGLELVDPWATAARETLLEHDVDLAKLKIAPVAKHGKVGAAATVAATVAAVPAEQVAIAAIAAVAAAAGTLPPTVGAATVPVADAVTDNGEDDGPARQPNFDVFTRSLMLKAEQFSAGGAQRDDLTDGNWGKVELSFALPRGSYATVLLRALGQ